MNHSISTDEKESIIKCTKALISQNLHNGWSTQSLYQSDRFFYGKSSDYDSMLNFSEYLSSDDKDFCVYISVSDFTRKSSSNPKDELKKLNFIIKNTSDILPKYKIIKNPDKITVTDKKILDDTLFKTGILSFI